MCRVSLRPIQGYVAPPLPSAPHAESRSESLPSDPLSTAPAATVDLPPPPFASASMSYPGFATGPWVSDGPAAAIAAQSNGVPRQE